MEEEPFESPSTVAKRIRSISVALEIASAALLQKNTNYEIERKEEKKSFKRERERENSTFFGFVII